MSAAPAPPRRGADVEHAARVLPAGGLVAFPTETVYGLGADASSAAALGRVFDVKGRPRTHPLIVHLGDAAELPRWSAELPDLARELAARFWPGPLTLIVRSSPLVSPVATGGLPTVGLRMPGHPMALAMLRRFGGGVAAPSANRFGRISPTTADHVAAELGGDVDYLLDGGACQVGVESTIVDVSRGLPVLLRTGGVPRAALEAAIGPLGSPDSPTTRAALAAHGPTPAAPGTLPSHYAPEAMLVAVPPEQVPSTIAAQLRLQPRARLAVLAPAAALAAWPALSSGPAHVHVRLLPDEPAAMARELYGAMRDLDAAGFDVIVAALPAEVGLGEAVADRLRRAAGPREPRPRGNND